MLHRAGIVNTTNGSMVMTDSTMIDRLKQFVESEMRSCSMDIGGITPLYVYRMWGGSVAIDEIATGLTELRSYGCTVCGITESRI